MHHEVFHFLYLKLRFVCGSPPGLPCIELGVLFYAPLSVTSLLIVGVWSRGWLGFSGSVQPYDC